MRQHFALTLIGLMLVALLGLTAIGLADKGEWAFETIDPPDGPSPAWNHASGINNRGQIVGSYLDGDTVWHSYLFYKGIYTEMSDPDSLPMGTALSSINDHGQMIGNSIDEGDEFPVGWGYGVLFDRDALSRILTIPNGKQFFTFGINNRGQITGTYGMSEESDYWFHIGLCGFLLDGETLIDISPPDADSTIASIPNDHGRIVGDYRDVNGEFHGFLYDKGDYVKIDFPGASETHAFGINNLGQIVGQYSDGSGAHGFLLEGQEFITIDFPTASWTRANGINDHGQIVGNYIGEDGLYHGFLAEPAEDFSNVFFIELTPGLNMVSLPLKPQTPYTARSLAEAIAATAVIEYDEARGRFVGFTPASSGDGFPIVGGKGYIVNVLEGKTHTFTGAAWTNDPSVEAAPSAESNSSGWAFIVSGALIDGQDSDYTVIVRNLRTGAVATDNLADSRFNVVFADLNRNTVIEAGDRLELVIRDSSNKIVAGPVTYQLGPEDIRKAFRDIVIPYGYSRPEKNVLLQNYPNPFNPETWIPFHLAQDADVSVSIYDAGGKLVRSLSLGHREAGFYVAKGKAVYWDGKSNAGEEVASGVYFYSINAGDFSATRKLMVRK